MFDLSVSVERNLKYTKKLWSHNDYEGIHNVHRKRIAVRYRDYSRMKHFACRYQGELMGCRFDCLLTCLKEYLTFSVLLTPFKLDWYVIRRRAVLHLWNNYIESNYISLLSINVSIWTVSHSKYIGGRSLVSQLVKFQSWALNCKLGRFLHKRCKLFWGWRYYITGLTCRSGPDAWCSILVEDY